MEIPSVAIYDGDVKDDHTAAPDEFYTTELCFEIEIVKTLFAAVKPIWLELLLLIWITIAYTLSDKTYL